MSQYYDLDQERAALAFALSSVESFAEASKALRSDLFEDTRHQRIWEAAKFYYQQYGGALDKGGLQALLTQNEAPHDKQVVYLSVLDEVRALQVTRDQFKVAAGVLEDMRFKRGLFDMINEAAGHLQRGSVDRTKVCNGIITSLLALQTSGSVVNRSMSFKEDLAKRQAEYKDRKENPEKYRGVPYGVAKIDELTGGMYKGELVIIFGRPGAGKSSIMHNVFYNLARTGRKGLLFTIEMPNTQLARRLDSRHLQISARGLRNASLNREEEAKYMCMQETLDLLPGDVFLEDLPQGCSVAQALPIIRRYKLKHDIALVGFDYLNLMEPSRWSNSKVERTGDVSKELKQLARLEDVPVITPARATRGATEKKGDDIGTEDMSWSDSLGYDADQIIFLRKDKQINAVTDEVEAMLVKFRDGSNERAMLGVNWDKSFMGDMEELLKGMAAGAGAV